MKFSEQTVEELQRLSDRALRYVRDGKPEHAQDCFQRMSRILTDGEVSLTSGDRKGGA